VFRYLRQELDIEVTRAPKKLPYVPTEAEIRAFFGAGSATTAKFAEQVQIVRAALAEAGRPPEDFPIAKRVYIGIDEDAERARTRMNAALERICGTRVPAIEAAAITGPAADCVREVDQVAAAGAELILFTALFDQPEQMEMLAATVLPKLG
jgi:alkanesulfonate monooxygenase SsuD/methylene tetrahydromethanopterin reductase-like flavin-dependent oxidoreductase (luciferase family)